MGNTMDKYTMWHRNAYQECNECGKLFQITYFEDGTYEYFDDPCNCESGFSPVDGVPSISEWIESLRSGGAAL